MDTIPSTSRQAAEELKEDSAEANECGSMAVPEHPKQDTPSLALELCTKENDESDMIRLEKDKEQALKLFPEEIWVCILNEIKDPLDLVNACNASLFFRKLLLQKRVVFLFPKVWETLDFKYHQSSTKKMPSKIIRDDHEGKIDIIHLEDYYKHCTSCCRWPPRWWEVASLCFREVCKTWSRSVDKFIQGFPEEWDASKTHGEPEKCRTRNFIVGVHNLLPELTDNFLQHFETTHGSNAEDRCPFIRTKIQVVLEEDRDDREGDDQEVDAVVPRISPNLRRYFEIYGRHLHYADIKITAPLDKGYAPLVNFLGFVPNLKVLSLHCRHGILLLEVPSENRKKLELEVSAHLCPRLPYLSTISMSAVPSPIINALLKANSQIAGLSVHSRRFMDHNVYHQINSTPLLRLKQLNITIQYVADFQVLLSEKNSWPVTKIKIEFDDFCNFIDWSLIFGFLEQFAETLTSLVLQLPEPRHQEDRNQVLEDCVTMKLKLPNLIYLKIEMNTVLSLDLILPMQESLEILEVQMVYHGEKDQIKTELAKLELKQVIKWFSVKDRLRESNIWTVFKNLRKITFGEACEEDLGNIGSRYVVDSEYTFVSYLRAK